MIEKKEFDLGNPSDHEKLEIWLNKKDLYGTKAKKKLVPALQKSFSKFVQELVQNDSVAEYQKKLLGERIKKKLNDAGPSYFYILCIFGKPSFFGGVDVGGRLNFHI